MRKNYFIKLIKHIKNVYNMANEINKLTDGRINHRYRIGQVLLPVLWIGYTM